MHNSKYSSGKYRIKLQNNEELEKLKNKSFEMQNDKANQDVNLQSM